MLLDKSKIVVGPRGNVANYPVLSSFRKLVFFEKFSDFQIACRSFRLRISPFEFRGRQELQCKMQPSRVVEPREIVENHRLRPRPVLEATPGMPINQHGLQSGEEALRRRVVAAVAHRPQRDCDFGVLPDLFEAS